METQAMPATDTRAAKPKKAKTTTTKKAAAKKPEKVKGILTLPSGKHEVTVFLGAFDRIEDAIAAREKGLALRESLKAERADYWKEPNEGGYTITPPEPATKKKK